MGSFAVTGKLSKVALTQAGAGTLLILAGVTGRVLRLIALDGAMTANGTIKIQSKESATDLTGPINLTAGIPHPYNEPAEEGYCSSVAGKGLQFVTTGGGFNGSAIVQAILP